MSQDVLSDSLLGLPLGGMCTTKAKFIGHSDQSNIPLIVMNQTHSSDWAHIDSNYGGIQLVSKGNEFSRKSADIGCLQPKMAHPNSSPFSTVGPIYEINSDALITKSEGVILSVKTADCLPVLVVADPFIAVIHAGRVGTIHSITRNVLMYLKQQGVTFVHIWFGPHSCVCCYEVDEETATHFDLVLGNTQQVESVFGSNHSINHANYCTQCHSNLFYSYRCGDEFKRNLFYLKK